MMSLMQDTAFGYFFFKQKPDPIEMVFIASVHTTHGIAEDSLQLEDVLEEVQDLKEIMLK